MLLSLYSINDIDHWTCTACKNAAYTCSSCIILGNECSVCVSHGLSTMHAGYVTGRPLYNRTTGCITRHLVDQPSMHCDQWMQSGRDLAILICNQTNPDIQSMRILGICMCITYTYLYYFLGQLCVLTSLFQTFSTKSGVAYSSHMNVICKGTAWTQVYCVLNYTNNSPTILYL